MLAQLFLIYMIIGIIFGLYRSRHLDFNDKIKTILVFDLFFWPFTMYHEVIKNTVLENLEN